MMRTKREDSRYRHELKFLIAEKQRQLLRMRLREMLRLDEHGTDGRYTIRSLYFDDYWNSALEEKEAGLQIRRKYRIRFYDYSDAVIRLECKNKFDNYCNKESAPLTREECLRILDGDYEVLLRSPHELCRKLYVECMCHVMRPRVIIDYEREAWVHPESGVRVTFDTDVRASADSQMLFERDLPLLYVLDPDQIVMEVKYSRFFPGFLASLLQTDADTQLSVSKYELSCLKMKYPENCDLHL